MEVSNPCKLCSQNESKYMCPRCNVPYCSVYCYQSQAHLQCSESFYKECVVEQIKNDELDPQSQRKMMEILQRVQQIDEQFDDDDVTVADSDDETEDEECELAARLAGVDLDDADSVWQRLTAQEKQQFQELLRTGDVTQVVPPWQPWWSHRSKKILIEDLDSSSPPDAEEPVSTCPPVTADIQPLSTLSRVSPSVCVRWHVVNVLAAYAVTARVYNGDHQSEPADASATLVQLSDNLAVSQLFETPEEAVAAVQLAALNRACIEGGVDEAQLKDDVKKLVEGPSETTQNQYVLAALSDVHNLLTSAKQKAKESTRATVKGEFTKKFPISSRSSAYHLSASELRKHIKKIEFYLSWTKECF